MKAKKLAVLLLLLTFLCLPSPAAKKKEPVPPRLPEKYRLWIEEEVIYIITPIERRIFHMLQSDRERDAFIEAFWKQRDPTPNTPTNEFRDEHAARIAYANNWFGKDSPGDGWRTDMGRTYITLGPPRSIDRFDNEAEIYPTVIWGYEGMSPLGLPDNFNVVFFKRGGIGEYEYYTPVKFGPQYLMPNYTGDLTDYRSAYAALYQKVSAVAQVSLTLIPNEPIGTQPSIASEILIHQKIPGTPERKINSIYAEKFLKYKDKVEVEYTSNYITSESLILPVQDAQGRFFIHYMIEPKRLAVEQYQQKFFTSLEINGSLTDNKGGVVYQFSRSVPVELTEQQIANVRDKTFCFQGVIPVVPGRHYLNVLIKNTASKEFTSLEKVVTIPDGGSLASGALLLANRLRETTGAQSLLKPFQFADAYLVPSPRNDFTSRETLYCAYQVFGLSEDLRRTGSLRYTIRKDAAVVLTREKKIAEFASPAYFIEAFPLADLPPANYTMAVELLNAAQKPLVNAESYFYISPMPALPRPWVLWAPQQTGSEEAYLLQQLGIQLLNQKEIRSAREYLERAHQKNPGDVGIASDFARLLLQTKEYDRIQQVAEPLIKAQKPEIGYVYGQALQAQGKHEEAIAQYAEYLRRFGSISPVWNAMAECELALGRNEEAEQAWEKSLAANPAQPEIQSRLNKLRREINETKNKK